MSMPTPSPRRLPTLEVVAQVAGVSRATVSRVINGVRNVDPELVATVQRAVSETGYVPNRAARSLVTGRTYSVALVVSAVDSHFDDPFPAHAFDDPFFGRIASGALHHLGELDMHMVLKYVNGDASRERLLTYLRQGDIDGVLLISMFATDPMPRLLIDAGAAAVLFARPATALPISYVDVHQKAGAALAADRLVARGCRSVVTISGPADTSGGQDRLSGFRDAMARHGCAYVPSVEGNFTQVGGESAMARLLDEVPDLDGVFAGNDLMALGAVHVLRDRGRRVPEDVAVIGFDDSRAAVASRPQLTTVRQPVEDMAAEMARLLLARIEAPTPQVTATIVEPKLVLRDSA
ncbi:MAG TPA: LacI family DNA-binding transcriptional regulator [Micromonosporaceae bacterium]|jgi:DNA-binding LacI/PurR family transcriptional regulator